MVTTAPRTRRSARFAWGLADQGLSSATNFAVGILVARSVSAVDFGAFSLVFALYALTLSISRAVVTEPFLVRFSSASRDAAVAAARRATGSALVLGCAVGVLGAAVAPLFGEEIRDVLLATAVCLPALLLQDAWRQVAFGWGREVHAFGNDLVWTLAMVPLFWWALSGGQSSSAELVLMWGLAAAVAAVAGAVQLRILPSPRSLLSWLREHRDLWPRFAGESALVAGAPQLYAIAIAAFAGLVAAGQIRLVLLVLGPVHVLIQGIGLIALPEGVRALARGRSHLDRHALLVSGLIAGGALAWGGVVVLAPDQWWVALAGPGWVAAAAILIPLSLQQVLNGGNTGAHVGLRAMQAAQRSLHTRIVTSTLLVVAPTVAVMVGGGVIAAAWSLAAVAVVNLVIWWVQYRRTTPAAGILEGGTGT